MDHNVTVSDIVVSDKNTLSNLFGEDPQTPSFRHLSELRLGENPSASRHDGGGTQVNSEPSSPLPPQSPESMWSRSPAWTPTPYPSHPSLHYCCISSLHRDGDIYCIAVSGDLVLTGSCSRRIHSWHSLNCHTKGCIHASSGEVRAMVAHGELLFTSHKDHKIRIWNMRKCYGNSFRPMKVTTLPTANSFFKSYFSFRPITSQHKVTSKTITPLHKDIISCMAYYHIEGILYTGSYDTTVKAWRVNEKKCIDSFTAHCSNVNDMVVNQQNGYLFTCSSDGTVKLWLRVYGENSHALIKVLTIHSYPIYSLVLSVSPAQEIFLYSGSSDGSINYWEQELSRRYNHGGVLQGHLFAVLCLATLEHLVISGSEDSTIRIWKRERGGRNHECLAVLEGHRGPVRCLAAYLQKDRFATSFLVYSASLDQTFKVWRVKLLPTEMRSSSSFRLDDDEDDQTKRRLDIETTPVLSPSWVNRKLHSRSLRN